MKLTPEDYLKMRDRCKELERDSIRQREHILDLERINAQLSDTINRMDGGCRRAMELRQLLDELFNIGRSEVVSDDEIRRRMKNLRDEMTRLRKENVFLYHQRAQLRNDKKQQADSILELQTELERLHVAAKESAEKIEVLNDSINQLQDECSKKEEDIRFWKAKYKIHKKASTFMTRLALAGFLSEPRRGFSFCYFSGKMGKISAHFSQIKSGHNPGKTGQCAKIGCFGLGVFENFWAKMAICPLSAHFLPTFEKPKNLVFSMVSGFSAHFPTFFLLTLKKNFYYSNKGFFKKVGRA